MQNRASLAEIAHPTPTFARLFRQVLTLVLLALGTAAPAATISGFTPDRGGPGTEVTVVGTGLQTAMFVYFGSTEASGEILARSATSVRARVPPNALTGQISIFTSSSGAASSLNLFIATPRVESFTPVSGAPGALVTISGSNFGTGQFGSRGNVTSVLFNGRAALFEVNGINQLLALVPVDATTGPITLANEAGSTSTVLPFNVAGVISSLSSTNGKPGDPIEIKGSNLGTALRIEFGLERADFTVISPSNLVARVPTNAVNARIQITTPAGSVATPYPFVVQPRIFQFQPNHGTTGTNVVLQGGGFHGVTDVQFNGTKASFTYRSSTQVDAVVPTGASSGPILIVTTNGTFTTTDVFHFPARINSFNPSSGKRGDTVTLDGLNLNGTSRVLFNGAEASSIKIVSPTRITAVIPADATSGRVTVETPAGAILSSGTFNVIPVLDSFSPGNAPAGNPIALSGAGLTNLAWVRLGDLDMTFTLLSPTSIRAIVPLNAFSGPIRIRSLSGIESEATGTFIVDGARPVITSFSPGTGGAGTKVIIQGQGFRTTSRVQFNGTDAVFGTPSTTSLEATVPAGASTGSIAVTTLDGIAVSPSHFVVQEIPVSLRVERGVASDEVVLQWAKSAVGYVLESSPSLGEAEIWTPVPGTPTADSTTIRVTVQTTSQSGRSYYRLRK